MEANDRIREKFSNETGSVISVHQDHIIVQWDSGLKDMVRNEYARKYLVKLEAPSRDKETFIPVSERVHPVLPDGVQKLYRFPNNYGASVIHGDGSYGYSSGLWKIAVVKFTGSDNDHFYICYDTGIATDVKGYLSESDVDNFLKLIASL